MSRDLGAESPHFIAKDSGVDFPVGKYGQHGADTGRGHEQDDLVEFSDDLAYAFAAAKPGSHSLRQ